MFDSTDQFGTDPVADQDRAQAGDKLLQSVSTLLRNSSIELTVNGEERIRRASEILPSAIPVYLPKVATQALTDKLTQIRLLSQYGLKPIPHIVARQLSSERQLHDFLQQAASTGRVRRVLVIGGDDKIAAGPFADAASVLASGLLSEAGIREVDVAGYPDGHPHIPQAILVADLEAKISLAKDQGFGLNIVTQFSFSPESVARYCAEIAHVAPAVPVYAGLVGPTNPAQLLRFAKICGVGTSMRAANKLGLNALRLATHSSPDDQFEMIACQYAARETGNLAGIHLFSFGGFVKSAAWLDAKARAAGLGSKSQ